MNLKQSRRDFRAVVVKSSRKITFRALLQLGLMGILPASVASAQPYATARYDSNTGGLYVYITESVFVVDFLSTDQLFDNSPLPLLGTIPPAASDTAVLAYFSATGLPVGLFDLGPVLPTGVPTTNIIFHFIATGSDQFGIETFPAVPGASARYNPITGALIVAIDSAAQAIVLNSAGQFNTGTSPLLGALSPSQFDASNLMFFNNDAPLPAGTFNLGAVLPPGLNASQISLATKGDGIAVGIPVTVVPEPAGVALTAIGLGLAACRVRRAVT